MKVRKAYTRDPAKLTSAGIKWSEGVIGRMLAHGFFNSRMVLLIRNCTWPGFECDMLGVTSDLRLVDVEIKISRADLKNDQHKDKWWYRPVSRAPRERAMWPRNVWKHYYVMPYDVWRDDLIEHLSPASGVLLIAIDARGMPMVQVQRRCTPNRAAKPISAADAINVARLANIRMWEALAKHNPQGTKRPRIKVMP